MAPKELNKYAGSTVSDLWFDCCLTRLLCCCQARVAAVAAADMAGGYSQMASLYGGAQKPPPPPYTGTTHAYPGAQSSQHPGSGSSGTSPVPHSGAPSFPQLGSVAEQPSSPARKRRRGNNKKVGTFTRCF